ncbi:LysR family transcriptional regulator [Burkholderia ubonensis]|uniref:LysR substrate-binding domain-containing protein n=1 Tax=Burkholderia ubonensis TaxID=101571 RepID=UPI0007554273|nr:LysR substrate-binding domain-containing protein [Burkholderia ubonensis]KVN67761.1 LysR family transcriptional regulator [Burkholderia ubonensis]KWI06003.1 LysR family transcriptional regulator [Burkholderia ubonensis]KWI37967.1 LysR family transcriptional regulator [Burkholderia ubonensis]ODQ42234.1 LysR family transcriptional regulator [Burkholderia ubonensis]OJA21725.1 LysR family transcriptional regulator [Burkholderia ubonensis]
MKAKPLPPVYALRAFESAARTGSFTLAAEELSLTQSAVSKHVRTLEAYFGRKLFVRRGPKMSVTAEGRIFATGLKRGFRQIEEACTLFQTQRDVLRLKAPSTLTMRWLLDALAAFRKTQPGFEVQITSVWMDVDTVDFFSEPYDCAILLGAGKFGEDTHCVKLFDEWLIPICSHALAPAARANLAACDLIHPSPDRRDWRRWLNGSGYAFDVDITRGGQVFDMLEQGIAAAVAGHGISIGDLALCAGAIDEGQLALPFRTAVNAGDAYYLVAPEDSGKAAQVRELHAFLESRMPRLTYPDIRFAGVR